MSKIYHPATPVANRVLEGHFGEAVMPAAGLQPGPVYVYDAGIRIWHWVTFLAIVALCVTGYFIGAPPTSIGGEAYDNYMFGWIRFTHFAAGMILGVAFVLRLYRVLVGGPACTADLLHPVLEPRLVEGDPRGGQVVPVHRQAEGVRGP